MKTYAIHYSARTILANEQAQHSYGTAVLVHLEDGPKISETVAAFVAEKFPEPAWYGQVWGYMSLGTATDTVLSINIRSQTLCVPDDTAPDGNRWKETL